MRQQGSHLHLWHAEKKRMTQVPIHAKDIGTGLLRAIIRQAGLTRQQFLELL